MIEVTAYQTYDGFIFKTEKKALDHEDSKICQMLDNLLPQHSCLTRSDRIQMINKMADKIKSSEGQKSFNELVNILNHED